MYTHSRARTKVVQDDEKEKRGRNLDVLHVVFFYIFFYFLRVSLLCLCVFLPNHNELESEHRRNAYVETFRALSALVCNWREERRDRRWSFHFDHKISVIFFSTQHDALRLRIRQWGDSHESRIVEFYIFFWIFLFHVCSQKNLIFTLTEKAMMMSWKFSRAAQPLSRRMSSRSPTLEWWWSIFFSSSYQASPFVGEMEMCSKNTQRELCQYLIYVRECARFSRLR